MKHTFLHFSLFRSYSFQSFFLCVLLSLSSTFCYSPLSFFAYPLLSLSVFLVCLLLSFLLPSIFLLWLCLSSNFSFSFYLFLCLHFPFWLPSTFILCLSSIIFPLLFSLPFCTFVRVCFLGIFYYYYCYHFYLPVLLFCIFYLSIFCRPFLLIFLLFFVLFYFYFALFFTLFNYLVLILDFNHWKSSLHFIFCINLCYLFPFSLTVFFTKCELFSFFTFQYMLCSVFWFLT